MSDPQREIRIWMQAELAKRDHGIRSALASFLDVRPDAITRMANTDPSKETREIKADEHVKMIEFFARAGEDDDDLRDMVQLVGYVGAGAAAHFYGNGQGELERVPAPKNATKDTVAVEIRGESLGPLFESWLVYYDEVRSPVTPDMIGVMCVVGLDDERVLIKRIRRARTPGLFHLESNTEPTINDVEIVWAAKVRGIEPR